MKVHIKEHFARVDPLLYSLINKIPDVTLTKTDEYFESLCQSIVSQQLSIKAADTIWQRLRQQVPKMTPPVVLATGDTIFRAAGVSGSKISYIRALARYVIDHQPLLFTAMANDEIIAELTTIKGIGQWTAEMFLMFTLGREDVFSVGDAGLRRAIKQLYSLSHDPTKKQMERLSKKWSPYRTYAARILWESLALY